VYNLINYLGICDGKQLREHMRVLFSKKGMPFSMTFEELFERTGIKFTVSATNLHYRQLYSFNYINTPDVPVIKALQASMCLPFIFQPVNIDGELYIDGGMKDNLPVSLTDSSEKVLAIKLETDENLDFNINKKYSFIQYVVDILDIAFSNVWPKHESDHVDIITIHVPYISIINFNLNNEDIQAFSNAGYDCMSHEFY
jgi:predicted acylesterase/phospholipase RssA